MPRKTTSKSATTKPSNGSRPAPMRTMNKRLYQGAQGGRLMADWFTTNQSADAEIRGNLGRLRNRARDLERNDDYARRFLGELEINVLGHNGFMFRSRFKNKAGNLDTAFNEGLEKSWEKFSNRKNFTVTRRISRKSLEKLLVRAVARDGEFIARKVRQFANAFAFSIHPIEADLLDHEFNQTAGDGRNQIRMGVEIDGWGAPVAYHFWTRHPGDLLNGDIYGQRRTRVPAADIIHVFIRERVGQTRGVTWFCSGMTRLKMLSGYEEAELVAARVAASKMGIIETPKIEGEPYTGDGADESGNTVSEVEPGMFEELPYGKKLTPLDFQHPSANYENFRKGVLRGLAAGLNVGYNGLAMDLEGVNYSSLRAGMLDEREMWKMLQQEMIDQFECSVFDDWFDLLPINGQADVPISKLEKFDVDQDAVFMGRRWPWVDPQKDSVADILAINARLMSRREIALERGGDIDEIFEDFAEDEASAKEKGIELIPVDAQTKNPKVAPEIDQTDGKPAKNQPASDD